MSMSRSKSRSRAGRRANVHGNEEESRHGGGIKAQRMQPGKRDRPAKTAEPVR